MTDATPDANQRRRCLILAPRSETIPDLVQEIARASHMMPFDVEVVTLDPRGEYGSFVSDVAVQIPRNIEQADVVIADITGANPNVMYELGFAHALKKPVLPIVQKGDANIPSDLQGYLYYVYDRFDLRDLRHTVHRWLERTLLGGRLP